MYHTKPGAELMSFDPYPSNSTCNQSGSWAEQLAAHKSGLSGTSESSEVPSYTRVVTHEPSMSSLGVKSMEAGNNHEKKTFRSELNVFWLARRVTLGSA